MLRCVISLLAFLLMSHSAHALGKNSNKSDSDNLFVYYFGFETESFAGVTPDSLVLAGCKYFIRKDAFLKLFREAKHNNTIDLRDVRAKVLFSKKEVYFIDKQGNLIFQNEIRTINRDKFRDSLFKSRKNGKCRDEP